MLDAAAACGMLSAVYAAQKPDRIAIHCPTGDRTFGNLHANANRLANALRAAGLKAGDGIALMCGNRAEFVETFLAALRIGLRITPVNWHLAADEARYIVENCQAKALFVEATFAPYFDDKAAPPVRICIGTAPNFESYATVLSAQCDVDPPSPQLGTIMLYTSGTTGRPKGVFRRAPEVISPQGPGTFCNYDPDHDVNLCVGPAYHAAPLLFDIRWPLASGVPIALLPKWNSIAVLETITQRRVTHAHMAPIMFHRLLALPDGVRASADCSSLKTIFHGAAPCPIAIKRAMIDWWGPILWEYYAASEGGAGIQINSLDWLAKPGSVGRRPTPADLKILRDDGTEAEPYEVGSIYLKSSEENPFEYFGAPEKTRDTHKDGYFTLGDVGKLDADDFLFLTGRTAECIISGGVNIYPQEVDDVLSQHPAVADCCTIGAPSAEWGEEVCCVVEARPGHEPTLALANELLDFVRSRLSGFKCPRRVDFTDALPRLPSGKIQRAKVRAPYWHGRETSI